MEKNKINLENIELMKYEVDNPIDQAKFIISNVYYYLQNFYVAKYISNDKKIFSAYLDEFKNVFKKKIINNNFSFDLLNRYISTNDISTENKTNEVIFYDLMYKKLINIILEQNKPKLGNNIIESFISLRTCFIFLEYLYLLLKQYPEKIHHYIIKIDISLLLNIPQKLSKRMINSYEFFYLNLIELKGLFPKIEYTPSEFINDLDETFIGKYKKYTDPLKSKKISSLKYQLSRLIKTLSNFGDNKTILLLEDLYEIQKNIKTDLKNNKKPDDIIKNYISDKLNNLKECDNKTFEQIINEIDSDKGIIPSFNYLYLIALNNFDKIKETNNNNIKNVFSNEDNMKNKDEINKEEKPNNIKNIEEINIKNDYNLIENEKVNDECKNEKVNDEFKNKKEKIIENEELRVKIDDITEDKYISELKTEEIKKDEDIYIENIKKNFTYDKVLNLNSNNIYEILLFLEIYNEEEEKITDNIDYIYLELKNKFISSIKNLNSIDYNYFYDLISDKNFHDEIIAILKSEPIVKYINENRYFEEIKVNDENKSQKEYEFEFVPKGAEYTENFSEEYDKLMKKLEDGIFFTNLFRLKYLPFGIKALVNYNLKIFINSLYYEFNENIKENNKKIILRAALKIIIIHEIMHIFKFLKNDVNFNKMPGTPREREEGKMLINYLFGQPVIKSINLEEAQKINDINLLRSIFPIEKELVKQRESYTKKIDHVDLYFTEEDIEDEIDEKEEEYRDIGIDID